MTNVTYPDKTETPGDPNRMWTAANANEVKTAVNSKADGSHTHSSATTSVAGFMSAADKTAMGTMATAIDALETAVDGKVADDDERLTDARDPLVHVLDHAPTVNDDASEGFEAGNIASYDGRYFLCKTPTEGAAVWFELTAAGGLAIVTGTTDPVAAPPSAPAIYRRTDTDALWLAVDDNDVGDWIPLLVAGAPMLASVSNPENKTGQYVTEDELDDYIQIDDLVDPGARIHVTGTDIDVDPSHYGKRVTLDDGARLRIPPWAEVEFPENFRATYVSRGEWEFRAGEDVSLNGEPEPVFGMGPLPNKVDVFFVDENDWEYSALVTETAAAPVAAEGLGDVLYSEDTGVRTVDASVDFVGVGISYSLISPPTGVTINSTTGVVSIDTGATGEIDVTITVRATNSAGYDETTFGLVVEAIINITGGTITTPAGYKVATLTSNGNLVIDGTGRLYYELVGGGGAGGYGRGGGGGAGARVTGYIDSVTPGTYAVVIGAAGGQNLSFISKGADGSATTVTGLSLSAAGGGGGGSDGIAPGNGGCGGGATGQTASGGANDGGTGTPGNAGGNGGWHASSASSRTSGGGGGMGAAGGNATAAGAGGNGGNGVASAAPGVSDTYCGGGGGWSHVSLGTPPLGGTGGGAAGTWGTVAPGSVGQDATGKGSGGGGGHTTRGGAGSPGIAHFWIEVA